MVVCELLEDGRLPDQESYAKFTDERGRAVAGQFKTRLDVLAGQIQDTIVRIGVTDSSQVEKAKIHEFGTNHVMEFEDEGIKYKVKGVPARSFIRMPLSLFLPSALQEIDSLIDEHDNNINAQKIGEALGEVGVEVIKEAFASQGFGQWPSHKSEAYKEHNDNPVLDKTGKLKNSIGYEIIHKGE